MNLEILDGEIIGVLPLINHPISEGMLCIKGWNAHQFIGSEKRILKPLIKEDTEFREASWDEALDFSAEKLKEIMEKYGSDSIGFLSSAKCTNEENFLMMKFARAVIGTNNIDHCARLCHASTVTGLSIAFGSGAMTNSIPEIEEADCILIAGSNTTEQHPLIGSRIFRAKERGAMVILVDPREVQLAKIADIYLKPKPGTDVAWINGFAYVILQEGFEDKEFIKEKTEGFEEFKKVILEYSPEKVEQITEIPKEDVVKAAKIFATAKNSSILYSMGITQHTTGTNNVLSLANLAMLTGNVGKSGSGVNPLRGHQNVQGSCDMGALPNMYSGYQKIEDEVIKRKFEESWRVKLPSRNGLTVVEMMNAALEGSIKGMYIMGENPVVTDPDLNHVKNALKNLEFLIVQDLFLTETAKYAHIVLPAASFAEKDGTFTNTDRRVQRVRKAIDPIRDSKPDWEILCNLAKRLGSNGFDYKSPEEIFEEIACLTPIYGGINYNRIDSESLQWPCRTLDDKGTKYLHQGRFTRGLGLFTPIDYKPPAESPDEEYPYILTTGRVYFLFHSNTMTGVSPSLSSELEEGFVEINPKDASGLNIRNGEKIKVSSRRGELEIKAFITERVKKGVIFIPFHFSESAVNVLTNPALDPEAKIPEFKVCAVKIEKI